MNKKVKFYKQQPDESDLSYIMRLYLMACVIGLLTIPVGALLGWVISFFIK